MTRKNSILALLLTGLFVAPAVPAQATAAAHPAPNGAESPAQSYRLTWTISEVDGSKHLTTQHFSIIVVPLGRTNFKLGSKVPVVTGSYTGASSGMQTQFTYLDVGLNIDASLDQAADGMRLKTKVEQSSIAEDKSMVDIREPIIRQATLEGTSMVTLGKPLTLGSLDIPGSTRHLDVEVVLEPVR